MEACLANTGQNAVIVSLIGAALVIAAGAAFMRGHRLAFRSIFAIGVLLTSQIVPLHTAFAAEACSNPSNASTPDTSTGVKGATQLRNVIANDTPTPNSSFVLTSLTLGLVQGHVLGSTISTDKKVVEAPGEGQYTALSNGSIRYIPDTNFVGTAVGVTYSIEDTAGNTTSNIYRPVVTDTAPPVTCSETTLPDQLIFSANQLVYSQRLNTYEYTYHQVESSANGNKLLALSWSEDAISQSVDGGSTWNTLRLPDAGGYWGQLAMSSSGSTIAASDDNNNTVVVSQDGGASWQTHPLPDPGFFGHLLMSGDGSTMYYARPTLGSPNLLSIHRSDDHGATWTIASQHANRQYSDMALSEDGQSVSLLALDNGFTNSYFLRSTDAGETFTEQALASTSADRVVSSSDGNTLVFSADNSNMYRSVDGGATWNMLTAAGSRPWSQLAMSANGQTILALAGDEQPYLSGDGGTTWSLSSDVPASSIWNDAYVSGDGSHIGAASFEVPRLSISKNSGSTWEFPVRTHGINTATIDLDTSTPGQQLSISGTHTDGSTSAQWTATYNPSLDELTITFDANPLPITTSFSFQYGGTLANGCPATPGTITFQSSGGSE